MFSLYTCFVILSVSDADTQASRVSKLTMIVSKVLAFDLTV